MTPLPGALPSLGEWMIRFIVELYRGLIGLAFVLGALIALFAFISDMGGYGPLAALVILAVTGAVTGLSAILLSINDHLAALRKQAE